MLIVKKKRIIQYAYILITLLIINIFLIKMPRKICNIKEYHSVESKTEKIEHLNKMYKGIHALNAFNIF